MAATITMPKLGLTMNSGSVQEWKKNIGDSVTKGELLFTVATDKLTVDIESTDSGVLLAVLVDLGQDVPVGAPLALVGEAGEQVDVAAAAPAVSAESALAQEPAVPQTAAPVAQSTSGTQAAGNAQGRVPSSPKAKKLAREKGIDVNSLAGTGPNGWVVAKDVLAAPAGGGAKASPLAAKMAAEAGLDLSGVSAGGPGGKIMKDDVIAAARKVLAEAGIQVGTATAGGERRMPVTQMRRVIGQRMLHSVTTIPSVNYFAEVDMGALNAFRASCNVKLAKNGGVKVSVNDIMMKFCAKLLLEHPLLNGSVEPDAFVMHDYANVGFAVALPGGLLVPNIKDVQSKSLSRIAAERAELVQAARNGALSPDQMSGGTFTISNLGMMDIDTFTPIINPPEVAILGLGATREKPAVVNGSIVARPLAMLSLTADHRLVDGADAAAFLAQLKDLIENPDSFLL